ncbi:MULTISPECIES: hypothetical protein [unclassified Pseudomonas]|jgi:hypothetical protein|uniref:hypothetical protein n=1 Tax=unclassified Pseudomonas TaxID=196821 RepID=UPI0009EB9053|nr:MULTISPECIES: hypothetical protein [unclassified Pseudomonas]WPN48564.1 hypothetical protein QMK58_07830 [Pseudomonas sp. P8_241]
MNKLIVVIAILALAGCTTNVKTHAVHGVSGVEVDCSGLGSGWERCQRRAAKECEEAGYRVVARSDDVKEGESFPLGFNPAGLLTRKMLVICR